MMMMLMMTNGEQGQKERPLEADQKVYEANLMEILYGSWEAMLTWISLEDW
jgi:hypothetical protein